MHKFGITWHYSGGDIIAYSGKDRFLADNGGNDILDEEEEAMADEVAEVILAAEDSPEYKHVDEKDAVPDETVKVQAKDHDHEHQAYKDLNQEVQLGIQATETLNSKKTSTSPGTARPAPRTGTRKPKQELAQNNQHKFWSKKTYSTTSKATSMMICKEKDIETVPSITNKEQHSQEKVQQQEDVHIHKQSPDDDQHEQIHESSSTMSVTNT